MRKIIFVAVICVFVSLFGVSTAKADMWDVTGTWDINVEYLGVDYAETLILTQVGTEITGVSLNVVPPAGGSAFTVISGSVIGNSVVILADHDATPLVVRMDGEIAPDGSSISGTWADVTPGTRTGTWESTGGNAVLVPVPGAVLLGMLGLSLAGVKLRKHA